MAVSDLYMESLSGLRDNSLLLSVAYEHLCEKQYLGKIGKSIDKNVQKLRQDISSLKKEFPGKFEKDIETEDILKRIQDRAQNMLEPSERLQKSCASGELGKVLESDLKSISAAINSIKELVRAEGLTYSRKDSISGLGEKLGDVSTFLGRTISLAFKILFFIIALAVLAFGYLFFTIEKEDPFQKVIETNKTHIRTQQGIISQLKINKREVSDEIKGISKDNLSRNERIAILDLEMKINNIDEDINKAQDEIATREKEIVENQKIIEKIREKTFIQKLLKQ